MLRQVGTVTFRFRLIFPNLLNYCIVLFPGYLFACAEEEFDCGRGQCIAASSVCDGVVTCPGGIDEKDESCAFSKMAGIFSVITGL